MLSPRYWLASRNIPVKKALGQHFLSHSQTAERILALSGIDMEDTVLEVGSGLGALTLPAAQKAKRLIAVETDVRLMELLREAAASRGLQNILFVEKDILNIDIREFTEGEDRLVVLGNLPYNISTPILLKLVGSRKGVSRAVLMLQREVAERITAPPGTKVRGRLSVLIQYCASVRMLMDVPASSFYPRPQVDSRVIEITFQETFPLDPESENGFFRVVGAAFGKRRKTLKNALSGGIPTLTPGAAEAALIRAGIDPRRRAETLSVAEFLSLFRSLEPGCS